jgi:methylmalonyl-CoA carboxyltransferase large subunit
VALNGIDVATVVVLVAVGCVLTYVSSQRAFRRIAAELRLETERQRNALTSTLKVLQTQVAELSQPAAIKPSATPVSAPIAKVEATAPAAKAAVHPEEEVTPEMLVVMAAAVTAFLGKRVRIRSAKRLQSPYEIVNPWSQQGRVFVQASHNLRTR